MPVLQADDRIPKIGKPSDVAILLAGCAGDEPEDLRDRALIWMLYSSGSPGRDAANLTIPAIDFETRRPVHRGRQGRQGSPGIHQPRRGRARPRLHQSRTDPRCSSACRGDVARCRRARHRISSQPTSCSCRPGAGSGEIGLTPSGVLQILTRRYQQAAERCHRSVLTACATAWRPTWPSRASTSARSSAGAVGRTSRPCRSTCTWTPPAFAPSKTGSKALCSTGSLPRRGRRSLEVSAGSNDCPSGTPVRACRPTVARHTPLVHPIDREPTSGVTDRGGRDPRRPPAEGERRAVGGYARQYRLAGLLILEGLQTDLEWICAATILRQAASTTSRRDIWAGRRLPGGMGVVRPRP